MTKLNRYNAKSFTILSVNELKEDILIPFSSVIQNTGRTIKKSAYPLGGRAQIIIKNIDDLGMVVFKNYFRGGFISYFNKRYYLRCKSKIRPVEEINFLLKIKEIGIPVPEPVAAYYKGKYIYQGGIVTKYINSQYNLAQFAIKNEEDAKIIFNEKFLPIYSKIIKNRIYHPDLHPGNVIVSNEGEIFIIDFDKADFFEDLDLYLMEKLNERWNRAVKKHNLPSFLSIDPQKLL